LKITAFSENATDNPCSVLYDNLLLSSTVRWREVNFRKVIFNHRLPNSITNYAGCKVSFYSARNKIHHLYQVRFSYWNNPPLNCS